MSSARLVPKCALTRALSKNFSLSWKLSCNKFLIMEEFEGANKLKEDIWMMTHLYLKKHDNLLEVVVLKLVNKQCPTISTSASLAPLYLVSPGGTLEVKFSWNLWVMTKKLVEAYALYQFLIIYFSHPPCHIIVFRDSLILI